ncbi:GNAT family N-acetyltransferase [Kribbella sp. NPDC026596]|uniref:GNAT family N-acetyltransferase n=1 Tax=Kribbella sp. NPDC026596 TaxID=3155122 RepID=UPI0033F007E1
MLDADQWQLLRDVRLRALKDSPAAYIADYEVEESWTQTDWRQRFDRARWVIARDSDQIIGLARVLRVDDGPSNERYIESVWVDPKYRGTGVLRAILQYVVVEEPMITDWLVWVLDDNIQARRVYDRLGFHPTGKVQPLADGSGRSEIRLRFRRSVRPG